MNLKALNSKVVNKIIVVALVSTFGVMSVKANAAEIKIGYVDMQAAIQQTSTGKKAKSELEKIAKTKEDDLKKREAALKKKGDDFRKKETVYDENTRRQKQGELQKEFYELQQLLGQSQNELRMKEESLLKPIVEGLRKQIDAIAKKEGYTVILEKADNLVLFAKEEINLTNQIVKAYEKSK
ncbi:MAG: OmpH family outer membrane protein [Bdellovibrionaceae bacterium]|nr:OmpH family outer membrane protein [Pseudobdellovibrionaceae bacterium]